MPRVLQMTLRASETDRVVEALRGFDGVLGVRLQRGVSLEPAGDVLTVDLTTRALIPVLRRLEREGVISGAQASWSTTEPLAMMSSSARHRLMRDSSEASWEEVQSQIAKESNATINGLVLMATAGAIAVAGIHTNALHLVVGAMVIAPGFEPISRMALGLVARSSDWRSGLIDLAKGYGALVSGALVTALLIRVLGGLPVGQASSYQQPNSLVAYWMSSSATSLAVSALAAIAGATLVAANRTVLTAGVMIALALVPAAALFAIGLASLRMDLLAAGLTRWLIELALVFVLSLLVFGIKQVRTHRRRSAF